MGKQGSRRACSSIEDNHFSGMDLRQLRRQRARRQSEIQAEWTSEQQFAQLLRKIRRVGTSVEAWAHGRDFSQQGTRYDGWDSNGHPSAMIFQTYFESQAQH